MEEDYPPRDIGEWRRLTKEEQVADQTIHGIDLNSASKLKVHQYLMLRVLWKVKLRKFFKPANFGLADWVERASRQLEQYGSWKSYQASFTGELSEGTFALARFYQKQVSWVPEDASSNCDVAAVPSPISRHTRSRGRRLEEHMGQITLETPSKAPKNPPEPPTTPPTNLSSDSGPELDDTPDVPFSSGPPELLDLNFPKTKDEQIVNTALLDFLNAFIVHRGLTVQWSLYRKPFIADFAKASIQARTDGCLEELHSPNVHALVEVKPIIRPKAKFSIPMQEAAQMVAWIKTNPDPAPRTGGCGR